MKTLEEQLKSQIEKLTQKLADSRESFASWQKRVQEQETELARLQKAWAALNGMMDEPFTVDVPSVPLIRSVGQELVSSGKANIIMVDGIEYEIPTGYKIGKNSFGETAIIPQDVTMTAMAEPSKPVPVAEAIAPAEVSTGFDRPEDLL